MIILERDAKRKKILELDDRIGLLCMVMNLRPAIQLSKQKLELTRHLKIVNQELKINTFDNLLDSGQFLYFKGLYLARVFGTLFS